MKFGLIGNTRIQATKGAKATCPLCGEQLIAKCGEIRTNHWSHKRSSLCDPWWENETMWHRIWKNNFPESWQEKAHHDELTGEKHIADVFTPHGLAIEFQHSHISSEERLSRELFYKRMIWVVDGSRLKNDFTRFVSGLNSLRKTSSSGLFTLQTPRELFPSSWTECTATVAFDFRGGGSTESVSTLKNKIICLLPQHHQRVRFVLVLTREDFVEFLSNDELLEFLISGVLPPKKSSANPPTFNRPTRQSYSPRSTHRLKRRRF
jgi:competence protein CoiA